MNIAFYAPLKPPDHPVPSGDRLMANLLIRALRRAGHRVSVASKFRSFSRDPAAFMVDEARRETDRLISAWQGGNRLERPDVWFTYHPYYKAPDLVGPTVVRALSIAYATAEASYAAKRDFDEWAPMQAEVADALALADVNFCMTSIDREGLAPIVPAGKLVDFPPFIDVAGYRRSNAIRGDHTPQLVTVAMMRGGTKLKSYRMLARALETLMDVAWHLVIVGDGPARAAVEASFEGLACERLTWTGQCTPAQVRQHLEDSDLYVWPGHGEAYGLAYLEAQACGLPVVAQLIDGVPAVVRDGKTGMLTPAGDEAAYARAIRDLLIDDQARQNLSRQAFDFVHGERALDSAAAILDAGLASALTEKDLGR